MSFWGWVNSGEAVQTCDVRFYVFCWCFLFFLSVDLTSNDGIPSEECDKFRLRAGEFLGGFAGNQHGGSGRVNVINKVSLIEFLCWWLKEPASFPCGDFNDRPGSWRRIWKKKEWRLFFVPRRSKMSPMACGRRKSCNKRLSWWRRYLTMILDAIQVVIGWWATVGPLVDDR